MPPPKDPVKYAEYCRGISERAKLPKNTDRLKIFSTSTGEYICKICGETFSLLPHLAIHTRYNHPKEQHKPQCIKTCELCGEIVSEWGMGGHMSTHHPKNPSTCKECGEIFLTPGHLAAHVVNTHVKNQVCKLCGKEFPNGGLGGHMTTVHPKDGIPHKGTENFRHIWEGMTEEEHTARSDMLRASKFSHLDDITITDFQRQMILGSLLGDMAIWKQGKKTTKYGLANPELRISHSTKQREYVMWKYEILKDIARKEPYEFVQKSGFGVGFSSCRFETKSLPCLNSIYDVVVGKDGKKHISQEWLDQITHPVALATWFMDDGSRGGDYFRPWFALGLSTDSEVEIIREWLIDKWGLTTRYYREGGSPSSYNENTYARVYISNIDKEKFKRIIQPYIIPSMIYKIDPSVEYKNCISNS
jgi:hypothetical protein